MFKEYLDKFCSEHGYNGEFGYDEGTDHHYINISKGKDNAIVSMSREELKSMNDEKIKDLLDLLDEEFVIRFKNNTL